jgi:hypothetical protein
MLDVPAEQVRKVLLQARSGVAHTLRL